ncbi:lichenicidin A2 family type 2 lantibiotic [Pseudobutyrivibrio sp.]
MQDKELKEVVGSAYEDLSAAEMENIQGAGDVDGEIARTVSIVTVTIGGGPISIVSCAHSCTKC